jgi:[protein-PII] uridylyltransferase
MRLQKERKERSQKVLRELRERWDFVFTDDSDLTVTKSKKTISLGAVGSLAREELGPHSDLDIVIIHDNFPEELLERLINAFVYPLWDNSFKVDYSVRTVKQTLDLVSYDLAAGLGWMQSRFIAGDEDFFLQTVQKVESCWTSDVKNRIEMINLNVESRTKAFGQLAYLIEPNIKEARGGIRDYNDILAIENTTHQTVQHQWIDNEYQTLLDVRDAIHYVTNRDQNTIYKNDLEEISKFLDYETPEDLFINIAMSARRIAFQYDSISRAAMNSKSHKKFFLFGEESEVVKPKFIKDDIYELNGELHFSDDKKIDTSALEIAAVSTTSGIPISSKLVESFRESYDGTPNWGEEDRQNFLTILASGKNQLQVWEALDIANIIYLWFPAWRGVRGRHQRAAIHRHTVDRHMIETVSCISSDDLHQIGMKYGEKAVRTLLIGAFFHDIGKQDAGSTGEVLDLSHSVLGARLIKEILPPLGFNEVVDDITLLIKEHLTLSETATKKDIEDEAVSRFVADALDNREDLLDILYLITKADNLSLEPDLSRKKVWTSWRESLVTSLVKEVRWAMQNKGQLN